MRTGVTAILPRGKAGANVGRLAGMFSLNGNGELTGAHWVAEVGRCDGPVTITNTHSVGVAHDASIKWTVSRDARSGHWSLCERDLVRRSHRVTETGSDLGSAATGAPRMKR